LIKINLCPEEELESPYWYVPTVAAAVTVAVVGFLGVQWYLSSIEDQIQARQEHTATLEQGYNKIAVELKRFETMEHDIATLNGKLAALRNISVTKLARYKTLIAIEHLQNVRPEGVWFEELRFTGDEFALRGQAFDNLLTAELITSMRATQSQEVDRSDLRTQVYFNDLVLGSSVVRSRGGGGGGAAAAPQDLSIYPEFTMKGRVIERGADGKVAGGLTPAEGGGDVPPG
jgi:Tfp pilus assembly protein PilN